MREAQSTGMDPVISLSDDEAEGSIARELDDVDVELAQVLETEVGY